MSERGPRSGPKRVTSSRSDVQTLGRQVIKGILCSYCYSTTSQPSTGLLFNILLWRS